LPNFAKTESSECNVRVVAIKVRKGVQKGAQLLK
jgi:hypothetical protein